MRITVQANSRSGRSHLPRAGRFWPTTEALEVEVLDSEEDPPPVLVEVRNNTTGRIEKQARPNPVVIGQATLRALENDTRLSIKQHEGVAVRAAEAAIAAARGRVQEQAGQIMELQAEVASLGASLDAANDRIVELTTTLEAAQAAAAGTPATGETKPAGEAKPAHDDGHKASADKGHADKGKGGKPADHAKGSGK